MVVAVLLVNDVMSTLPTNTSVALLRLVPVSVTEVPAVVGPADGLRLVNVGAAVYVYVRFPVVPPAVTTLTLTPPAACAGNGTTIMVAVLLVNDVMSSLPTNTSVALVRLVPVSVTEVPAVVGPDDGLRLVNVGPEV